MGKSISVFCFMLLFATMTLAQTNSNEETKDLIFIIYRSIDTNEFSDVARLTITKEIWDKISSDHALICRYSLDNILYAFSITPKQNAPHEILVAINYLNPANPQGKFLSAVGSVEDYSYENHSNTSVNVAREDNENPAKGYVAFVGSADKQPPILKKYQIKQKASFLTLLDTPQSLSDDKSFECFLSAL